MISTEVNELKITKLSEAALAELDANGGLNPNQIYVTDEANEPEDDGYDDTELRNLIDTKANANASNLSADAVSSWKTKLGVVSIEYDESTKTINIITGG